ncbi:hypothetical protein B0A50_04982 [Salinomyces thailandicus]|uniref:Mediator of RNA polymerase II transcription subunit 13 n=1 Tax=Salinomyces thailandicus TaxID=706561 RepID=A0A4U0TY05_9PEZI|nr:hypothetical protein B0A50_04982 [Salinomyces thailandica]
MDFFKSCKSNVQTMENCLEMPCHMYTGIRPDITHTHVAELRAYGALCASDHNKLWVFGHVEENTRSVLQRIDDELNLEQEGPLSSIVLEDGISGQDVKQTFFEAIQGAVSTCLTRACGAMRVGPFTWLLTHETSETSSLLQLRLNLTTAGTLYAMTSVGSSQLLPLSDGHEPSSNNVRLAPSNRKAELILQLPSPKTTLSSDRWKAAVAAMLSTEGNQLQEGQEWLPVRLSDSEEDVTFTWPAQLCFAESARLRQGEGWKHWFEASDEPDGFSNPLAAAEEWFKGAEARMKAAQATQPMEAESGVQPESNSLRPSNDMDLDSTYEVAAPFSQRVADQQASMAGIYPTPEDVLVTSHTSQQPSSDNVMVAFPDQSGQGAIRNEVAVDDGGQARDHSSSSDPPAFLQDTDDLFGDMGGMDFVGDEVGDADFDFFNEQDEAAGPAGASREDMEMPAVLDQGSKQKDIVPEALHHVDEAEQAVKSPGAAFEDQVRPSIGAHDTTAVVADQQSGKAIVESPATANVLDRPLSPFGIRERLLPPPVPASRTKGLETGRSSTFEPLVFREGLDLGRKFSDAYGPGAVTSQYHGASPTTGPDISLPPRQKKRRLRNSFPHDQDDTDSEDDSDETASSISDRDLPPQLPWDTKKRKRATVDATDHWWLQDNTETEANLDGVVDYEGIIALLERLASTRQHSHGPAITEDLVDAALPTAEEIYVGIASIDIVYIAQLVGEQAVSCVPAIQRKFDGLAISDEDSRAAAETARNALHISLERLLPGLVECSLPSLAPKRESLSRAAAQVPPRPGQPRPPPQRSDHANPGPDIMALAPPYIRVQRGNDAYEMLPAALSFWEPLSLSPLSGPKGVRAYCVLPLNDDLQRLADNFLSELGNAYESAKLGSHCHLRSVDEDDEFDDFESGMAPVELGEEYNGTLTGALMAYHATCSELGSFLSTIGHVEPDRTIVVYMLNPFPQSTRVAQLLCACFWQLYKVYRDNAPKSLRGQPRSDIVLQLLSIDLVASPDTIVPLDANQLSALAKEVYDRCPPSPNSASDASSALPNFAAPFAELASPLPKRINFQVASEPPSDLLHEGSSLHMAYAVSTDGQWMTVSWVDSTGKYQSTESWCLRGKSFAEVAAHAWDRTRDLLAPREVTWRIFIVTPDALDDSLKLCWRKIIEKPRKQPFSVTLLSTRAEIPGLQLSAPIPSPDDPADSSKPPASSGPGFPTPATTPQPAALTASPDPNNPLPPPTPAPTSPLPPTADQDPEAHLVDLTDETWGMLLSPALLTPPTPTATTTPALLASGALFKRPASSRFHSLHHNNTHLPSLPVTLHWTLQVRPTGTVDEGNARQAEMTLREVLRAYRNLGVLTKARGLVGEEGVLPVHVLVVRRVAEGLGGLLG